MKVKVELDRRELTLIRVALLQRLDRLKRDGMTDSYDDTRELLTGKLWTANKELSKFAGAEG